MNNSVRIGSIVTLFDFEMNEKVTYEIVQQSRRTQYIGRDFASDEYKIKSIQVLDKGGDGFTSVSDSSPLGRALLGHKEGDLVSYKDNAGEIEEFKILKIEFK